MRYEIVTGAAAMDLDAVHAMLAKSYWSARIRREVVERALANSLVVGAFAIDDRGARTQVGVARAVTDFATFAWLCDVYVEEAHRGRGLSKRMIEMLFDNPELRTLRRWCLATRDAHGLYERYGFAPVEAGRWMERKNPASAWQE